MAKAPPKSSATSVPPPTVPDIARADFEDQIVNGAIFQNKKFSDLNALNAKFKDCDFRYSIFERAYFRSAEFINCKFDGCLFFDCNLHGASFFNSDLRYARFFRSLLQAKEIVPALPAEPNLRRGCLQNLIANALEIGDFRSIGFLVLQEIDAQKLHHSYAIRGFDNYYRRKYNTIPLRGIAWIKLMWLRVSGAVWGHGEKPTRLVTSATAILAILALVKYISLVNGTGSASASFWDQYKYVIDIFLDTFDNTANLSVIDYTVVLMRYIYMGLFISMLYKAISHR